MRFDRYMVAALAAFAVLATSPSPARSAQSLDDKVKEAREVYQELIKTPDREIPEALLDGCKCVAVFPHVIKGAIGVGARYGKGVASCRDSSGAWSPLAFFTLGGGSFGFQFGAEATDVVLFFMTERGTRSLVESKFTLGAKAGLAAGPVGRSAEAGTDIRLEAEIYSYGRSKGLFAGISLEGARIAPDGKSNREFYGEAVEAKPILFGHRAPRRPEVGEQFLSVLPRPHQH
jgi:lipid-binding SYLF domain-containing protein